MLSSAKLKPLSAVRSARAGTIVARYQGANHTPCLPPEYSELSPRIHKLSTYSPSPGRAGGPAGAYYSWPPPHPPIWQAQPNQAGVEHGGKGMWAGKGHISLASRGRPWRHG